MALYLNVFVGIVQTFQKVPFFQQLAPTQSEPPFIIAQSVALAIFAFLGYLAVKKFHPPCLLSRLHRHADVAAVLLDIGRLTNYYIRHYSQN